MRLFRRGEGETRRKKNSFGESQKNILRKTLSEDWGIVDRYWAHGFGRFHPETAPNRLALASGRPFSLLGPLQAHLHLRHDFYRPANYSWHSSLFLRFDPQRQTFSMDCSYFFLYVFGSSYGGFPFCLQQDLRYLV